MSRDTCRYCGLVGHRAKDCRKKKREEAHLVQGGAGADGRDEALLLIQACILPAPAAPQLTAPAGDAQPAATVPATSALPVAETASQPVAKAEVQPTPTQLPTRIHWVAQWDTPAEAQPADAQPCRLEDKVVRERIPNTRLEESEARL